jgi:hypothetical protein
VRLLNGFVVARFVSLRDGGMFDDGALPRIGRRVVNVFAISISEPRLDVDGLRSTNFDVVVGGGCNDEF